jgi:hypothetical protein
VRNQLVEEEIDARGMSHHSSCSWMVVELLVGERKNCLEVRIGIRLEGEGDAVGTRDTEESTQLWTVP